MLYEATKKVNRKPHVIEKISHGVKGIFLKETINHS